MLLLDLNLNTFQHGEQLRRGLSHPLHVVVQHKAFVARGKRLQHPINCMFIWNLTFQSIQELNVARHFHHVLTHDVVLVLLSLEEGFKSLILFSPRLRCKYGLEVADNLICTHPLKTLLLLSLYGVEHATLDKVVIISLGEIDILLILTSILWWF